MQCEKKKRLYLKVSFKCHERYTSLNVSRQSFLRDSRYLLSYPAPAGNRFCFPMKEIRKAGRDACISGEINFPQYEKPPTGHDRLLGTLSSRRPSRHFIRGLRTTEPSKKDRAFSWCRGVAREKGVRKLVLSL